MIAMLILIAAAPQPSAHISATATARIVRGARVALAEQQVQDSAALPQRTRVVRQDAGQSQTLHLIEFQ
jgi:hypothetical protein